MGFMSQVSPEVFIELMEVLDDSVPKNDCRPITVWVPITYKEKYDLIQARSKSKFGKFLRRVIQNSIDKVKTDQAI